MNGRLGITVCFTLAALLTSPAVAAEEWNVATGGDPARYGYCSAQGPEDATLLWQGGAQAVIGWQPVTDGDIMVVARCFSISDVLHGTLIYAYDIHTGQELWSADLPVDFPGTDWRNHVSGIGNGVVYASRAGNTNASYMYALDATDGSQLWKSEDLVNEASTEGVSFTPEGDLIVGNFNTIMRVSQSDGSTQWTSARNSPTSNGSMAAVFNGRAYGWAAGPQGPTIQVFDLDTGDFLYESPATYPGYVQQVAPFVGPDGTVYAPRTQNNPSTDYLIAYQDTGTSLVKKWDTELGYVPFSSFSVGQDGSVYSYSRAGEIVRLDPEDGSIENTSINIQAGISTYMAADGAGRLFAASENTLYSFNADLTLRWQTAITNPSAPAIAWDGTLILCGTGTDIRAYEGASTGIQHQQNATGTISLAGNPVTTAAQLTYQTNTEAAASISVYDSTGRRIHSTAAMNLNPGSHSIQLDTSGYPAGIYMVELRLAGEPAGTARMAVVR